MGNSQKMVGKPYAIKSEGFRESQHGFAELDRVQRGERYTDLHGPTHAFSGG